MKVASAEGSNIVGFPTRPRIVPGIRAQKGSRIHLVAVRTLDGRDHEIYQMEWELAQRMDGAHTLEELALEALGFGATVTAAQVGSVVRQLQQQGIVEGGEPAAELGLGPSAPLEFTEDHDPLVSEWSERRAHRQIFRRRAMVTAGAGILAVALAAVIPYPLKVTAPAEIRPGGYAPVRAATDGVISKILKREGEPVRAQELIAELDGRELGAQLAVLQAQGAEVDAELVKLRKGSRPEEIARATDVVDEQQAAITFARTKLERTSKLFASGLASGEALDAVREDVAVKADQLAHAEAELSLVKAGARHEDVLAKEAVRRRIEAELAFTQSQLQRDELTSPIDGVVITPRFSEDLGKAVRVGDLVAEVAQTDRMRAEISVPEEDLDALALDEPVLLKVVSLPNAEYRGRVEFISPATTKPTSESGRVVRVVADVDNPGDLIKDKMSGWAEISGGKRSLLALFRRHVLRWIRVRFLI
jgi:multidrug efflux pump subunit AcrA (membrane-fusion protein)